MSGQQSELAILWKRGIVTSERDSLSHDRLTWNNIEQLWLEESRAYKPEEKEPTRICVVY